MTQTMLGDAKVLKGQAAFCRKIAEAVQTAEAKQALLQAAALFECEAMNQEAAAAGAQSPPAFEAS